MATPIAQPIHLILDFDGTITRRDTMHILASAGYHRQSIDHRDRSPTPWSDIVDAYMKDYNAHTNTYSPRRPSRTTIKQELLWLESLREVEEGSYERVIRAGVFDNVKIEDLRKVADKACRTTKELELRDGLETLIASVRDHNEAFKVSRLLVSVVSVNWSASFIEEIITSFGLKLHDGDCCHVKVYANELPSIALARRSKQLDLHYETLVRTAGDKARCMQTSMADCNDAFTIYVGDSMTDLECMLNADLGICIRDEPIGSGQRELADTCERLGIYVRELAKSADLNLSSKLDQETGATKTLWWAPDFATIQEVLLVSSQ